MDPSSFRKVPVWIGLFWLWTSLFVNWILLVKDRFYCDVDYSGSGQVPVSDRFFWLMWIPLALHRYQCTMDPSGFRRVPVRNTYFWLNGFRYGIFWPRIPITVGNSHGSRRVLYWIRSFWFRNKIMWFTWKAGEFLTSVASDRLFGRICFMGLLCRRPFVLAHLAGAVLWSWCYLPKEQHFSFRVRDVFCSVHCSPYQNICKQKVIICCSLKRGWPIALRQLSEVPGACHYF